MTQAKQLLHASERIRCPECEAKAMRPVVDHTQPNGIRETTGYCYACQKMIGTGPRRKTRAERAEALARLYTLSTAAKVQTLNGLASFLLAKYGDVVVEHLRAWDVGTDGIGCCVYWYRDVDGELQTAKIVPYERETGKRRKGPDSPICWTDSKGKTHNVDVLYGIVEGRRKTDSSLSIVSFSSEKHGYQRPLYGAHLVGSTTPDVPVLLVEAEKTAVVASMFGLPFVVVATGGANGLTKSSAAILAGRDVYVLLDADDTGRKAVESVEDVLYSVGARPIVDVDGVRLVDYLMPEAPKGYDLADYYLSQDDLLPCVATAETPQLVLDVQTQHDLRPTAETPQSVLDVQTQHDLHADASTRELDPFQNVDGCRSSLLRAFGNDSSLMLDELHRRLDSKSIAGGRSVLTAGTMHKMVRYVYVYGQRAYRIDLLERAA
jgi:hypothetical protein